MLKNVCFTGEDNSALQNATDELRDFSARKVGIENSPRRPIFS
jgi:hypothetical protein